MTFRPARFVPFMVGRRRIGWLAPELAARLAAWPAVFRCSPETVVLLKLEEFPSVVEALAAQGFIPGWRNERYRIAGLCDIERAAARPFGLTTHAVHVNGISDTKMWLARRSASKAIDPGLLDTLVGGGVTAGLSIEEVLVKEAWEEAGISPELARRASRGGTLEILREVPQGVQSEVVHVYDLVLPSNFEPRNQDGEVSEFCLLSVEEALACRELTLEAELSAKDYFSRRSGPPGSGRAGAGRRSGR
jgi:8-oxo-dGTP pyrophosphatase MutT (NUDIX family)